VLILVRNFRSFRFRSRNLFFLLDWISYELARFCDNYYRVIMKAL